MGKEKRFPGGDSISRRDGVRVGGTTWVDIQRPSARKGKTKGLGRGRLIRERENLLGETWGESPER